MKTTLIIQGMHCNACKMLIEDECTDVSGVTSCSVDMKTGNVVVEHDKPADLEKVKKVIEGLGKYKIIR